MLVVVLVLYGLVCFFVVDVCLLVLLVACFLFVCVLPPRFVCCCVCSCYVACVLLLSGYVVMSVKWYGVVALLC